MRDPAVIPVLEVDLGPGIRAFFTTRSGGVSTDPWGALNLGLNVRDEDSAVLDNRALVDAQVGAHVTYATQVHGRDVRHVEAVPAGAVRTCGPADALVTDVGGAPLGVLVADCVPVLLADPTAGVVAVAHAGRAGVALGVVAETVDAMVGRGARADAIVAVVGPAVCGACYEVPQALQDEVCALVPVARARTAWGTPALDLPAAVHDQLSSVGVRRITDMGRCTVTDHEFFSHRRASAEGHATGRFAGIVMLEPSPAARASAEDPSTDP